MNKLKIKVGFFRSGKIAEVPWLAKKQEIADFISTLSIPETVDVGCLLEFHFLNASRYDENTRTFDEFANLFKFFADKLQEPAYRIELENLNLRSSIDRVNLGRRLSET